MLKVDRPKKNSFRPNFYSKDEVQQLLEVSQDDPLHLCILITAYHGLRRSCASLMVMNGVSMKQIDTLAQRYDPDKLEELLDNIVEMYCCPRQTQYIGKQPQTTKAIRLRLDKLTSQHVEYIFDVMSNTTQPIKNIMAYLRTTILNAPTTMEHYYQAQGNWLTAQNRKK